MSFINRKVTLSAHRILPSKVNKKQKFQVIKLPPVLNTKTEHNSTLHNFTLSNQQLVPITTSRRFKCVFLKWLIPLDVVA